jgi:hypothetical protein
LCPLALRWQFGFVNQHDRNAVADGITAFALFANDALLFRPHFQIAPTFRDWATHDFQQPLRDEFLPFRHCVSPQQAIVSLKKFAMSATVMRKALPTAMALRKRA